MTIDHQEINLPQSIHDSTDNSCNKANINENNEKIINNEHEISKLIKALPKDIAALDKRSVLANVNSQGSGT